MTESPLPQPARRVLSVVLPAYNEEAAVEQVIREHIRALESLSDVLNDWEVVCLNDGSNDDTGAILERLAKSERRVKVLHHHRNQGIHASLVDLYEAAGGNLLYVTASDGQWPVGNLERLLTEALQSGADLVVGVRRNRRAVYGFRRLMVSQLFNLLPFLLFGVKTGDAGSNKLGRKELLCTEVVSASPFAEAERIVKAALRGANVRFVEIDFAPRSSGKTTGASWKSVATSFRDVLRCVKEYGLWPTRST